MSLGSAHVLKFKLKEPDIVLFVPSDSSIEIKIKIMSLLIRHHLQGHIRVIIVSDKNK